ncbi:MAG: rhomboid family intramembrane serine protease [Gammaproteobacteria bacterium]
MLFDYLNQIQVFFDKAELYLKPWAEIIGVIWLVNIFNWIIGSRLNILGIYPRQMFGLSGIIFSPFLHASFGHLLFNSIPLFFLGLAILANGGAITFIWVTLFVAVLGGFGVWLVARRGVHIGASGVISGYFGYILMTAYRQPGVVSVLLAILAIYYFGGIFLGLFPTEKKTSWESHLFGFMSGVLCAYLPNVLVNFIKH